MNNDNNNGSNSNGGGAPIGTHMGSAGTPLGHALGGRIPNHHHFSPSSATSSSSPSRMVQIHRSNDDDPTTVGGVNHLMTNHELSVSGSVVGSGAFSDVESVCSEDPNAPAKHDFMVSFLVDARGGSMLGCRHSGVKVSIDLGWRRRKKSDLSKLARFLLSVVGKQVSERSESLL